MARLEAAFGVRETDEWVDWADALGVGAFCVIGAQNGIRAGVPCAAAVACGMFTATFGGVVPRCAVRATRSRTPLVRRRLRHHRVGGRDHVRADSRGGSTRGVSYSGRNGNRRGVAEVRVDGRLETPVYAGAEPNVAGGVRGAAAARRKGDDGTGTRPPFAAIAESVMDAVGLTSPPPVEPTRWRGWFGRG